MNKPHFIIKENLQKTLVTGERFRDVVTPAVLEDVCYRITGLREFTYEYVDNSYSNEFLEPTYNKGRIALMFYGKMVHYISFSEKVIRGRNSSVQSVPTAFNMFYKNLSLCKKLHYYFLNVEGNAETEYQMLIYRLMATVGFNFLNADDVLHNKIIPFSSIEDIMFNRRINAGRNRSNNSSYMTKNEQGTIEIYGKTYGANKYETSLMCYAAAFLVNPYQTINLFEVLDGDLKELPASSLSVIEQMGVFKVIPTDMTLEKTIFNGEVNLRSPRYIFNLLDKLGSKHCALCNCEIPELIQGAHVWSVSDIKNSSSLSLEEKIFHATSGDNGLWLCENHHKLFDEHMISFNHNGGLLLSDVLTKEAHRFIDEITLNSKLPDFILTDHFLEYLWHREQTAI